MIPNIKFNEIVSNFIHTIDFRQSVYMNELILNKYSNYLYEIL